MREILVHDRKKKDRLNRFLVSFEELTMKKTVGATLTLALLGCLMAAPAASYAVQNDPDTFIIESLEFDQADIRDVLKVMFRSTGFNYTVAPDVQGVIQVSLKNVPFKVALRNVLNQANATWREEGNIFNIIRKPDPVAPQTTDQGNFGGGSGDSTDFPPITLINDPQLILDLLLGNTEATTEPETSSFPRRNGGGLGGGFGGGGGGFGGGGGGFGGGGGGFGGGGFGGGGGGIGGGGGGGGFGGGF